MTVHAHPRPKLTTTVRAFEAQGNRQLFPATRNPSARTPAHAVIVPIRRQSRALIVTRRRTRFDCVQNCQHNIENTHRPMVKLEKEVYVIQDAKLFDLLKNQNLRDRLKGTGTEYRMEYRMLHNAH